MELEKFARQLRLMAMLTQNRTLTVDEIGEKLNMNRRSVYRYIDAFKNLGFVVKKAGTKYSLDSSSPFFREITNGIHFTEDEALTINQVLNSVYDNSSQVRHLREKLSVLYDTDVLAKHGIDYKVAQNISTLYKAIREERVVVLMGYNSVSSGKVANRYVEPYMFLNQNNEVRCYEISTNTNKTFKVARIEEVKIVDLLWSHKSNHLPFYSDMFGFTGDHQMPVSLALGKLATCVLLEEYPDVQYQLTPLDDGRQRFDTLVCSYIGIGRFVLGLYDDIEILNSPDFSSYMDKRITLVYEKWRGQVE